MNRRSFLQGISALFGAAVIPPGLLSGTANIPDIVPLAILPKQYILMWLRIGNTIIDLQGSLTFPAGCRPEVRFENNTAMLYAGDTVMLIVPLSKEESYNIGMAWYELDTGLTTYLAPTSIIYGSSTGGD